MASYEIERAERDLSQMARLLRTWCVDQGLDSSLPQNSRSNEFYTATEILEDLVKGLKPQRRLELRVGSVAITASRFWPGMHDSIDESTEPILPGRILWLATTRLYTSERYNPHQPELYAGDDIYVRSSTIADALDQGGELAIVEDATPVKTE
jgi:hypothetical protein